MTRKTEIAFPTVANIRKGAPKPEGKPGADLKNLFRVAFAPGTDDIKGAFVKVYGSETPERIRAMIPFPKVNAAWEWYNEAYQAGRMVARANDDRFLVYRNPTTGVYEVRDGEPYMEYHPGMHIAYERNGRSFDLPIKPSGRLRLWLPELGRMVFFELKTTSYYDCMNIGQNLAAVQGIADALNHGNAAGIPLWIYRKEQAITWNKSDGTATRVMKWLVQIEVDPAFVMNMIKRMSEYALTGGVAVGLLPAPELSGDEDPETADQEEEEEVNHRDTEAAEGEVKEEREEEKTLGPATTPAQTPEQILAGAAHNGDGKLSRPMTPAVLRAGLVIKAGKMTDRPAPNQKQTGLAAMLIEQCFSGQKHPDKIRRSVTRYLFDKDSLKDLTGAELAALLDWLKPEQRHDSSEYIVNAIAARELSAVWPESQRESGQMELI